MNPITQTIAESLAAQITSGAGSVRMSFGGESPAFAWAGGTANAAVAYVTTGSAEAMSFAGTRINSIGFPTPYGTGDKSETANVSTDTITMALFPGYTQISTAQLLNSSNLAAAVASSLHRQAQLGLDAHLVAQCMTEGTQLSQAASIDSIIEAQGQILGLGGSPNLAVVAAADYATFFGKSSGILGIGSNNPQEAGMNLAGSRVVISSALNSGEAIVMDASGVVAVEHAESPVAIADVQAKSNTIDLVVEVAAGIFVTAPDLVIPIKTVTK